MACLWSVASIVLISSIIPKCVGQKRTGSNIICGNNYECANYDITCDAGSDCTINCVGGSNGFGHQCSGATLNCPDNYKCSIHCDGQQSCRNTKINGNMANSLIITTSTVGNGQLLEATINCPNNINADCNVECDNLDQQCKSATVNAEQSRSLNLTCLPDGTNIGNNICTDTIIKCPMHNLYDGSCFIEGKHTANRHSRNMRIYSLYGFSSVEISGFRDIGTMYCNTGYLSSCSIGINTCSSCTQCACNNPTVKSITDEPTDAPSNLPTNIPTDRPTNYPSGVPSSYPSYLPTLFPSDIPSKSPSVSPTNAPTPDYKNKANVTVKFKNGTNIENITDVVKENISPDSSVVLIATDTSDDKIIAELSVSSDEEIEGEVIEEGIKKEYGDDVDVEVTYDKTIQKPEDDQQDDVIMILIVTIAALLLIICIFLTLCIYYKRKNIANNLKEGTNFPTERLKSTSMVTVASVASAATIPSSNTFAESTELMEISNNTLTYMHVVTASDCLNYTENAPQQGPENDPEIFSEGGNNTNNINKATPQFSVENSEYDDMYDEPQQNRVHVTPGNIAPVNDEDDDCSVLYDTGNNGGEVLQAQTPKLPPPPTRAKSPKENGNNKMNHIPEMEEIDNIDIPEME